MEKILELAGTLGDAIAQCDVLVRYREAKGAYESNAALREMLFEYNTQRSILGEEFKKDVEEQSPELISLIRGKIEELGKKIMAESDYHAFADAQQAVNNLMQQINSELSFRVFGERPCTHDCSSCHADCSSRGGEA